MTIGEAIKRLEELKGTLGEKTDIYFDCPHCDKSFTPDRVVKVATHFKAFSELRKKE